MEIIFSFLDYAKSEYGLEFPSDIDCDGSQHRYKMPQDKGCSKSGFITFYLDENPMAVFGCWKSYGSQTFKWFFRDQKELSKAERDQFEAKMQKRRAANERADKKRKKEAAMKAGELWSLPDLGDIEYQYLREKGVGAHGVKFFDNQVAFEFFASEERKQLAQLGSIDVYPGAVMVVPVVNVNDQLVSLQQISSNGKFKGFLPNGTKKGCFHVMRGNDSYVFVCEGYATGATIFELTGCTTYIAFDCGNLEAVCMVALSKHDNSEFIIASDDDRFTMKPVKNPGQTKAIEICGKTPFYNMCPVFLDNEEGSDWNDLLKICTRNELKSAIRGFIREILAVKV